MQEQHMIAVVFQMNGIRKHIEAAAREVGWKPSWDNSRLTQDLWVCMSVNSDQHEFWANLLCDGNL